MKSLISKKIAPNAGIKRIFLSLRSLLLVYFLLISFVITPVLIPDYSLAGEEEVKSVGTNISAKIFAPIGDNTIVAVDISPDGKYIISGDIKNSLKLWDISTGKEIQTWPAARVGHVAFSPDGRYFLATDTQGTIWLWDVATGKEIRQFTGHAGRMSAVAFSPDGRYFLDTDSQWSIKLWDVSTGKELRSFVGHTGWIRAVAFSADGRYALSGSQDETMRLWNVSTGEEIRTFAGHRDGFKNGVTTVAFSADGIYAISLESNIITLWNINTGKIIKTLSIDHVARSGRGSENRTIEAAKFSPDGRYLLTTDAQGTIWLWDVATGKEIKRFFGHTGQTGAVTFSNDVKSIISGGIDGTIRLWDLQTGKDISLFVSLKDGEWIVLTPEGYYNSSPNGHKYLNIRLGKKVYGIDQFYDVFYRPDIVAAKLRGDDISSLITLTIDDAIKNPPPTVKFAAMPSETDQSKAKVCYSVNSTGGGIGEIRIFQNGKLIKSDGFYREVVKNETTAKMQLASLNSRAVYQDMRSITVKGKQLSAAQLGSTKGNLVEDCVEVEPIAGENEISLTAFNAPNTVQSFLETEKFTSTATPAEPHLYILSVGIDKYRDASINLKYAAKDAVDFSARLSEKARTLYKPENIHLIGLANEQASKQNILATIDSLSKKIKHGDCFILFDASHGLLLQGQYYIVTSGFDGKLYNTASLISSNEIVEISKKIKSLSQLFIFDTCHAGGVDTIVSGLYDARMSVLAKKMGLHIFASAGSVQTALDGFKGNGLYTHTLLQGIGNGKDVDSENDGTVTVTKLGRYSKNKTTEISSKLGHPQTPFIINFGRDNKLFNVR